MGLFDSLLGGQQAESGISAATKALLLVLAAKAAKDYFAHRQQGAPPQQSVPQSAGPGSILGNLLGGSGQAPGALNSITSGGLGNLLSGLGGAGALGSLVDLFRQNGHGAAMNSWVANGPNQQLQPNQIGEALGPGPLRELEQHTGLPQQTLLEQLARELPVAIDHVTPQGRLPNQPELESTVGGA